MLLIKLLNRSRSIVGGGATKKPACASSGSKVTVTAAPGTPFTIETVFWPVADNVPAPSEKSSAVLFACTWPLVNEYVVFPRGSPTSVKLTLVKVPVQL